MSVLNEIPALGPSSSYCVARRWMWTSCADTDTLNLEGGGGGGGGGGTAGCRTGNFGKRSQQKASVLQKMFSMMFFS